MKTVVNNNVKEVVFVTEVARNLAAEFGETFMTTQRSYDELLKACYFNEGTDNEIRIIKSGLEDITNIPTDLLCGVTEKTSEISGTVKVTENEYSLVVTGLKNETEREALVEVLEAIGAFRRKN